jgi:transcriptional regulator with XRE-family HTH domain
MGFNTMNRDDQRFLECVGDRVRDRRVAAGLTQAQLGDRAGLHRTFIGSVERGERNVALLSLRRIAAALRMNPAQLLADGVATAA